jgi:hypothetical protein
MLLSMTVRVGMIFWNDFFTITVGQQVIEIGAMSILMTINWLEPQSPFFFYQLRQRLIDFELPFCDKQLNILNTNGAREILKEKKIFIENFIRQITDELQSDSEIEQMLLGQSRIDGGHKDASLYSPL